jgi:hypothetical protein
VRTDANEWEPYSDDQNRIIEKAYQNNAECVNVTVPDYGIDLKLLIQMSVCDSTKQRPIKRVNLEDPSKPTNMCFREERFSCCSTPIKKTLNRIDWITRTEFSNSPYPHFFYSLYSEQNSALSL